MISILIVNYNVSSFLEQCLLSIRNASQDLSVEVIVVDNASVDDSMAMLQEKFPEVIRIENTDNVGFSKANNQGARIARGEYLLLLNPDTLLSQDTLSSVLSFMESRADAGALGVKMMDGRGCFLPESKRGLPTPEVAFYKIFGLARLFPRSKRFGQYYLTYLDENQTHVVDVLAGAFIFVRRSLWEQLGGLDEDFFMYGEDIDFSYRVTQAGFKNYYFPETQIIHYKGESTKKASFNYVMVFYQAMDIFARKHFTNKLSGLLRALIRLAIVFRASLSLGSRFIRRIALPLVDALSFYGVFLLLERFWSVFFHHNVEHFGTLYREKILPVYVIIWVLSLFFAGAYRVPLRLRSLIIGMGGGLLVILAFFALMGQQWQYSRALILMGGASFFTLFLLGRWLLSFFFGKKILPTSRRPLRYGVWASPEEFLRVSSRLLKKKKWVLFAVDPRHIHSIDEVVKIQELDGIIFCTKDVPVEQVIAAISERKNKVDVKIIPENSDFLIGSQFVHTL